MKRTTLVGLVSVALTLALPATAEAPAAPAAFGTLELELTNVTPIAGDFYVGVHPDGSTFPKANDRTLKAKAAVTSNPQTVVIEKVPYGTWAVAVWHDANGDGVLQTGIFGIPKEPMGTSNNPKPRLGPPRFDDAKFELKQERLKLSIRMAVP